MQKYIFYNLLVCVGFANCDYPNVIRPINKLDVIDGNPGEPLLLTPYIKENNIEKGKLAAEVSYSDYDGFKSFAGYFTVNDEYNSNMFFWFFPSEANYEVDPIILWLQGGPGVTSLIGLFQEHGPFSVDPDGFDIRNIRWTKSHSVLYVDNPVGTGFSFTNGGYATNETQIGEELYSTLIQFFTLFPELQKNDFFITGESYAGKYIPAIAYTIYKKNPESHLKINLQGLAIGNGFSDPEHQSVYSEYLYQLGIIDLNTKQLFQKYEEEGIQYAKYGEYLKAFEVFDILINGDKSETTIFKNVTGFDYYFNYLFAEEPNVLNYNYMAKYLQKADVRAAIHVGNTSYEILNESVEKNLRPDVMRSVAPWISELLENYRVLIYNGQLDIICAYSLTVNYLRNLNFSGAEDYKIAPRHKWYFDGELAGYVKEAGNLTEILIRNSGHMVPSDQPERAYDLIYKFTRNISIYLN